MYKQQLKVKKNILFSPCKWRLFYDLEDNAMLEAFYTWKQVKEDELNKKWQSQYGSECTIFLERDYNDISMSDWKAMGYGNDY